MHSQNDVQLDAAHLIASGQVDEAIAILMGALTREENPAQRSALYASIGMAHESVGRYGEAETAFRDGTVNSPTPWCSLHEARVRAKLGTLSEMELKQIARRSVGLTRNTKLVKQYIHEIRVLLLGG